MFKKSIACLFLSLIMVQSKAQWNDTLKTPSHETSYYDLYLKKSVALKSIGWITLPSGIVLFIGGLSANTPGLCYLGGAATLSSIPLFIAARKNRRKAGPSPNRAW